MQAAKSNNSGKVKPFHRLSVPRQKTSAEIVSEARVALRTLRTQRPLTPAEDQRKLFGSGSSRPPQSRPPSVFSLHASSFDLAESRPMPGIRLSPLDPKLTLPAFAKGEDSSSPIPKPPADAAEVRKVSSARACLFRRPQGSFLSAEMVPPDHRLSAATAGLLMKSNSSPVCSEGLEDKTRISQLGEEELFWHIKILPILHELDSVQDNTENLCLACTKLYQALKEGNLLGKIFEGRSMLLKTLYKLVDIDSDPLRLKLAKIILAMKVAGKNLLSVCKLAFQICRNDKNDPIIQNERLLDYLLEVLRTEELQKNTEALLYCMGAIKFMSGNATLLNEMVDKGAAEMLLQLMKQINNIRENDTHFSSVGHLLVQLTATLRRLAECPAGRRQLLGAAAGSELGVALELRAEDRDVCADILSTFGKLSSHDDFCAALADCSRCYSIFLALLNKHQKQQGLVVRIVFILGNLTAKSNQAREWLFKEKGSINTLLLLFQTYHELDLNAQKQCHEREGEGGNHPKHPSEAEDVQIKVIRVLANLSVHPSIGAALAASHRVVELLVAVLEHKAIADCEELVIDAATAITNLSYYKVKSSAVQDKKLHIAEMLLKLLLSNNVDGAVEAVRGFGNLSQYHEICDFILQKKAYKFMIALLDSKNQDVCFSACGVLLNLTADQDKGALLMEEGGIGKLVECLQDFGPADWQLACLICKTLWNYSENITSAASCFGEETNTLLLLLTLLLDEELVWNCSLDRDLRDYHKLYWEREFKPVAEKLLHRIQSHH